MDWIASIVEHVFKEVPYSEQALTARRAFETKLSGLAESLAVQGETENQTAGTLLREYGSIDDACELIGIDKNTLLGTPVITTQQTKRWFRRYEGVSLIAAGLVSFTLYPLLHLILVHQFLNVIAAFSLTAIATLLLWRLYKQPRIIYGRNRIAFDAAGYLQQRRCVYRKRFLNSSLIGIFLLLEYSLLVIIHIRLGIMSRQELSLYIVSNTSLVLAGIFLIIKNAYRLKWIEGAFETESRKEYFIYSRNLLLAAAGFWIAATAGTFLIRINKIAVYSLWISFIYVVVFSASYFITRRRYQWARIVINKRRIAVFTAIAVVFAGSLYLNSSSWFTQPYISTTPYVPHRQQDISYDEGSGVYTIKTDVEDFKILQLSDIHLGGSLFSVIKDYKALNAVYTMISETQPDLVIVTGDLVFPVGVMSLSLNNFTPVMQFASFMRNIGVPWVFTYGNHDTEAMASHSEEELDRLLRRMSYQSTQSLLYPQIQPDITGRSNQLILIENRAGELQQALFVLDSNSYMGRGFSNYDYIHDDQVQWYEDTLLSLNEKYGKTVSSLLYFHIPVEEYREAYELYKAGSDEVKYYYGTIGEKDEAICSSDHPSNLFEKAVELGSTKAMFVGHDHYNSLSVEYQGIRLTYGMSIDYLAMPGIEYQTEQRGGTMVTLRPGGNIDIKPIKLTDVTQK